MTAYTEDNLVQKTTAEYLIESLDWNESVYAMHEVFGGRNRHFPIGIRDS